MADDAFVLSADDRDVLLQMVRAYRAGLLNVPGRPEPEEQDHLTPEVHIALVPLTGIPARSGTTPGNATCEIYRIDENVPTLEVSTAFDRRVYNLSDAAVDPATTPYVTILRDKFGKWLVAGTATSSSTPTLTVSTAGGSTVDINDGAWHDLTTHSSLAAGTWLLVSSIEFLGNDPDATFDVPTTCVVRLDVGGSTGTFSSQTTLADLIDYTGLTGASYARTVPLVAYFTLGSATTVKVQAQRQLGSTGTWFELFAVARTWGVKVA